MSEPMRVAQIIGKTVGGGVETVVMNYYRHIDRSKVQFDFFVDADSTVSIKEEVEALGGRVFIISPYQKINKYISELTRLFRENNYKIVHSHMNTLCVFSLYAAKRAGVPVRIAHNHSTAGKGETKKNIMKYMLRPFAKVYATHYAACSEYAGEWLFGKKSMENGEVTVFNNAIDLEKFKYNEQVRDEVRKELGVEDNFVVGHVGRFCYQKNHEFLINVFEAVHKVKPESVLILVGDGETRSNIENMVNDKGLTNCVKFLGIRADVERLYQAMDVFVLPSRYEGLGLVAVEAQTAGVPVVASSELPEEVKMTDSIKCISLSDNIIAWLDNVLRFSYDSKKDNLKKIEECGYNIKIVGDRLIKYYDNIMRGR